jgi:hypothetical protein
LLDTELHRFEDRLFKKSQASIPIAIAATKITASERTPPREVSAGPGQ